MFRYGRVPFKPRDAKWRATATPPPRVTAPLSPVFLSCPHDPLLLPWRSLHVSKLPLAAPHASKHLPLSIATFQAHLPGSGARRGSCPEAIRRPFFTPLPSVPMQVQVMTSHLSATCRHSPGAPPGRGRRHPTRGVITNANTDHPPITGEQI